MLLLKVITKKVHIKLKMLGSCVHGRIHCKKKATMIVGVNDGNRGNNMKFYEQRLNANYIHEIATTLRYLASIVLCDTTFCLLEPHETRLHLR